MMLERETRPWSGSESLTTANPERTAAGHAAPERAKPTPAKRTPTTIAVATMLTNARLLVKGNELSLALHLLRAASNRESKNPAVLRLLAEVLEKTNRHDEALVARRALARVDGGFETTFEHAQALYRAGRDEEALAAYYDALSQMTEEHPALFEIQKNMGNVFVRRGDYDSAEECYNKAHAINPRSDVLLVNFGTLEVQRGDMGRSLEHFRRAVELNSANDRAWAGLAMIHDRFGDHELAWGGLERALDINPMNRTAVILAAHWAIRDQSPRRAIPRLQDFVSAGEADDEISLALVNLYCAAGRIDLANLETGRVLAWSPARADVRELWNRLQGAA